MQGVLDRGVIVAGDFRIDGIVGDGGMGVVYEATQLSLERTVALKLVATSYSQDLAFRERFRREGRIQATLEHPHVIDVYAAGQSEQGLYLAMRLVRGPSLAALIGKPSLTVERTVHLLTQIASALDAAHEVGLVHRDMKPHNILIDERRDHSYLADFGVTKARGAVGLTQVGQLVGTLAYMAPEQFKGYEATEQSDIYAFGAVLFESLVGTVPFAMPTEASIINAHLSEPVPKVTAHRPELPTGIDDVVVRAMAKEPDDRYTTATELMDELAAVLAAQAPAPTTLVSDAPEDAVPATATRVVPAPEPPPPASETRAATPEEHLTEAPDQPPAGATIASPTPEPETSIEVPEPEIAVPDETTVGPPPPTEPTTVPKREVAATMAAPPGRAGGSRRIWAVGAVAVAGLAVAAFVGGKSSAPEKQKTVVDQTRREATAGDVAVTTPVSWQKQTRAPRIPGLRLANGLTVAPSGGKGGGLTAATTRKAWPTFLPASFRKSIGPAAVKRRQLVRIGGLSAYRYANVKPKGYDGSLTVYAVPQSRSELLVACYGSGGDPPAQCDDVAASLQLQGGTDYDLAPSAGYAATLKRAVGSLNGARARGLGALGRAATQKTQAAAASRVAAAYAAFVKQLGGAAPTAYAKPAHTRIVADARASQRGYTTLGSAASAGSAGRYDAARKLVRAREAELRGALNELGELGYSV